MIKQLFIIPQPENIANEYLGQWLSEGYQIVSNTFLPHFKDFDGPAIWLILYKPDSLAKAIPENELVVTAIASIERAETRNSGSPMWRCQLLNGDKLNIFQHDDPERDTFHIIEQAAWSGMFNSLSLGDSYTYHDDPIPICIRKNGKWWELVQMQDEREHRPVVAYLDGDAIDDIPFAYPDEDEGAEDEA